MGCNALSWLQQEFSASPSSELSAHSLSIIRPKNKNSTTLRLLRTIARPTELEQVKCVPQADEDYLYLSVMVRLTCVTLSLRIAFPLLFVTGRLMFVQPCTNAPFQFETTGSLPTSRSDHTATLLPSGKTLVAGGDDNTVTSSSAEPYDRGSGTWTATGTLQPHATITLRRCCRPTTYWWQKDRLSAIMTF
jgi:hypothetical protein